MIKCWMRATALAIAVIVSWPLLAGAPDSKPSARWIEAWYSPPLPPTGAVSVGDARIFSHQTVRQVLRLQAGGQHLRVRLTNELGLSAVAVGSVHVALSSPNGVTRAETDRIVTFGGKPGAQIMPGQALVSDPVDLNVAAFSDLAVSIYFPGRMTPSGHLWHVQISGSGDHGADSVWAESTSARAPALASAVEVQTTDSHHVVVAFGDSITEGSGSTPGAHMNYPELLARRLERGPPAARRWVVINSGISGNRVLNEGTGPSALDRFERDALAIPGVDTIIVLEGINDIGVAFDPAGERAPISAADLEGAYKQLIAKAHARGLKVVGGTVTPYEGAGYFHPEGEAVRAEVNRWIRTGGAFDAVIDFEQAVRDPRHPTQFLGANQVGDNLHPNDAGYEAMAGIIPLELFK